MSESRIVMLVTVIDHVTEALRRAEQAARALGWAMWWGAWGTNGWKRQAALVVTAPDRSRS